MDVVIVGGGPAGATTALAFAHAAPELVHRVVVLEKERYPRDKPCAGALGGRGDALLRDVDVEVDVPSVTVDGVSLRCSSGEAVAAPGRIGRVVRRIEFDHALVRAAARRGVAVRDGVRVLGVRAREGGGAVVETSEGEIHAGAVVGCDGVGSVVRRAMGVGPGALRAQVVEVDTEPLPADRDRSLIHFDASDRRVTGYAWDFPTIVAGRALVCRGVYRLRLGDAAEPDVAALLDERLRALGVDPAGCSKKRYAERGFEPATRLAAGAMMLAGEAAGVDPATGEGIAQAIEYGVLAGRYLASRSRAGAGAPAGVDDWSRVVSRSRLARDLRIRTSLVRLFFGRHRLRLERLLTRRPDMLHVGCEHFAAMPHDWRRVGRLALQAAEAFLRAPVLGYGDSRLSMRGNGIVSRT